MVQLRGLGAWYRVQTSVRLDIATCLVGGGSKAPTRLILLATAIELLSYYFEAAV